MLFTYMPDDEKLLKYARVLVNYNLNGGRGLQPNESVLLEAAEFALPMLGALQSAVLEAGGLPFMRIMPSAFEPELIRMANDAQLSFFPADMWQGMFANMRHRIYLKPFQLLGTMDGLDPVKVQKRERALLLPRKFQNAQEDKGLLTWVLAWLGTDGYARLAGMTPEEYWEHVLTACMVHEPDPVAAWRRISADIQETADRLNSLPIRRLHIVAEGGTDLWITIGQNRRWVCASGRNNPSFEIYTSPDKRGTQGTVSFNQTLFYNGIAIPGVRLTFERGKVVEAHAAENEETLLAMLAQPDADMLGEVSLTDLRHSPLRVNLCCTLMQENMGGNNHVAVGASYRNTLKGDPASLAPEEWDALGFNNPDATTHVDMVDTRPRVVYAYIGDDQHNPIEIYRDGQFTV